MCGRFTLTTEPENLQQHYRLHDGDLQLEPRYNICPGEYILLLRQTDTQHRLARVQWGLVPHWAKNKELGRRLINARAETLAQKPSFREAFYRRRCLIPADGFYEWQKTPAGKQPYWIGFSDKRLFSFAGLWEHWTDKMTGEYLETCTIITTDANTMVQQVHNRMPVILNPDNYQAWLDISVSADRLRTLLCPYQSSDMRLHPVSTRVNRPGVDSPDCIERI